MRAERQVSELPRIVPLSAWLAESANELAFDAAATCPHIGWTASPRRWCGPRRSAPRRPSACCWTRARRRGWPWTPTCSWTSGSCACHRARTPMNTRALPAGAATARPWPSWTPRMRTRVMRACWTRWARAGWQRRSGWCWPASPRSALRAPAGRVRGPGLGHRPVARRARPRDAIAGPSDRSLRHRLAATGSRIRVRPARAGPGAGRPRRRARAGVQRGRGPATGAPPRLTATQLQVHPTGRYAIVSPQLEAESVFARRVLGQALAGRDSAPARRSTWPAATG